MSVNPLWLKLAQADGSDALNENRLSGSFFWEVASGKGFHHAVYNWESAFPSSEANYIFVRRGVRGEAHPLYIGETDDLARRIREHYTDEYRHAVEAKSLGATEVHVYSGLTNVSERREVERSLRARWDPPINRQKINPLLANRLLYPSAY